MRRLRIIRFASWYHGSYGLSFFALPYIGAKWQGPFGTLDAYFHYLPYNAVAALFIVVALSSRYAVHEFPNWYSIAAVLPQQLVLLWGTAWCIGICFIAIWAGQPFDARNWLGIMFLGGLSYYHCREAYEIWVRVWGSSFES